MGLRVDYKNLTRVVFSFNLFDFNIMENNESSGFEATKNFDLRAPFTKMETWIHGYPAAAMQKAQIFSRTTCICQSLVSRCNALGSRIFKTFLLLLAG